MCYVSRFLVVLLLIGKGNIWIGVFVYLGLMFLNGIVWFWNVIVGNDEYCVFCVVRD